MHSLLSYYLKNHNQYTQCNDIDSKVNPIYCGITQASIFSMYINDLPLHIKFRISFFADDTVLILKSKHI